MEETKAVKIVAGKIETTIVRTQEKEELSFAIAQIDSRILDATEAVREAQDILLSLQEKRAILDDLVKQLPESSPTKA